MLFETSILAECAFLLPISSNQYVGGAVKDLGIVTWILILEAVMYFYIQHFQSLNLQKDIAL